MKPEIWSKLGRVFANTCPINYNLLIIHVADTSWYSWRNFLPITARVTEYFNYVQLSRYGWLQDHLSIAYKTWPFRLPTRQNWLRRSINVVRFLANRAAMWLNLPWRRHSSKQAPYATHAYFIDSINYNVTSSTQNGMPTAPECLRYGQISLFVQFQLYQALCSVCSTLQ
jgi:hypothetical protein